MTFLAGNRRKRIATAAMWTKTQNRLLALTLMGSGIVMPLQAQTRDSAQAVQLPDGRSPQSQRMNRQPGMRTRSEVYGVPPTAPTASSPAPAPQRETPALAPAPQSSVTSVPEPPPHRATVSYTGGQLSIVATNSSLNQILRDISRTAGITITGGVAEERVFGNYGPGTPAEVIGDLLDGTGSNMLFVQGVGGSKSELVLTTRSGGPTPPNPNASRLEAEDAPPPQPPPPPAPPQPPVAQETPAADNNPPASSSSESSTPAPAAVNSSGDSSTSSGDQSNGAKTPQQIFDELMKLRQQQQNQPRQ